MGAMKFRKILKGVAVAASIALTIAGKRKAAAVAQQAADSLKRKQSAGEGS